MEDSEVADLGPDADSARLQRDDYQLGNAPELSVRQQNDRLHEQAQGYAERYQMAETHTVNRSKAFVLEKERGIDIHPQIDEFAQARKEWDKQHPVLTRKDRMGTRVEKVRFAWERGKVWTANN